MAPFWRMKIPLYYKISLLIAIGGMLFGLDTGTIGPVTTMTSFTKSFGSLSATVHGLVVSAILIPAAISSLFAGNVADVYGRPRAIVIGSTIFGTGAAIEAASVRLGMFIAGRIIKGFGEGFFLSITIVYVCEISPASQRGPLASLVQGLTTVGIAVGYFFCYGTSRIDSSASWRVPLAFQALLAFTFASCCFLIPPSPRWLVQQGRKREAVLTVARLGIPASELDEIAQISDDDVETPLAKKSLADSMRSTIQDISKVLAKNVRKRTALGCFMMAMQQFSGIDGVLYYAPLLFKQAGLSSEQASFLASGVSALVILGVTIPASILADHWGRRPSTIIGGAGLATCMLVIGSLYASNSVHADSGAGRWVVIVTIYLFAVVFSTTWAIGFKIYSSEIHPPETRASASSLAQSANWSANWIVAFTTPIFLAHSSFGVYFLFGSTSLFTCIVCWFAMPETRGMSLESINDSFEHHVWPGARAVSSLRQRISKQRTVAPSPNNASVDIELPSMAPHTAAKPVVLTSSVEI